MMSAGHLRWAESECRDNPKCHMFSYLRGIPGFKWCESTASIQASTIDSVLHTKSNMTDFKSRKI